MANQRVYKNGFLMTICIILGIALIPIILSRILWDTSFFSRLMEIYGRELARIANLAQIFLAPPLGLLDLIFGFVILLRNPSKSGKVLAITSIIIGVLGILTGFIWLLLLSGAFGQVY